MNKINTKKKKLALIGALAILLTYHSIDYQYHPTYEILEEQEDAFATYSEGRIFIGNGKFLKSLTDVNDKDILILDERNKEDPNFKIFNSASITNKNIRNEILEVLCRYEECFPSRWDRTIESMRVEWFMHNLSYFFEYQRNRTTDVDLNNNDENYYNNPILRKILKL